MTPSRLNPRSPLLISVVIPTKDRPEDLRDAIAALLGQTLPPSEIVVVDQSATNVSEEAIRPLRDPAVAGKTLVCYERDGSVSGAAEARNRALERSRGEIVVWMDDDAVPESGALEAVARVLMDDPGVMAACGVITNYRRPGLLQRCALRISHLGPLWDERQPIYWNWDRHRRGKVIPSTKINGGFAAFRREALAVTGGCDPRYRGASVGEDVEISQRLIALRGSGRPIVFVADAQLTHASRGAWKRAEPTVQREIVCAHFLMSRRKGRNLAGRLCFAWLACCLFAASTMTALRGGGWGGVRSYFAGLRCIRAGYAGCGFLKPLAESRAYDGM